MKRHIPNVLKCKCGTQPERKRTHKGTRFYCDGCGLRTLTWQSADVAKGSWNNLVKDQAAADKREGFNCDGCGRYNPFAAYVFAHWDELVLGTCAACGAEHKIVRGHIVRDCLITPRRKPNTDASGRSYNGEPVNFDARTGDSIWIGDTFYFVRDTYPHGVRVERPTQYGPEVTEKTYKELKEAGAIFSDGCV